MNIPTIPGMQHSIVDILLLGHRKLLARYLSGSISSLWHDSPATILHHIGYEQSSTEVNNERLRSNQIFQETYIPSSLLFLPSHGGGLSLLHAYAQYLHNSLLLFPTARIKRADQNKTNLDLCNTKSLNTTRDMKKSATSRIIYETNIKFQWNFHQPNKLFPYFV